MGKGLIKLAEGGALVAVIGDEDTVTGFLLAGVGQIDPKNKKAANFLVVDNKTTQAQVEDAFKKFLAREDVAILLINQHIANDIRYLIDQHTAPIPSILEIPSKDNPYDPTKDSVMNRAKGFFGQKS
eukprot:CAMPEP_0196665324 /NCGR_PEP_ID=MMETSP1086-20130531/60568_1 /TAXON_ID=77921 /ORGANISM="Cyanoptyche  gloeocystis , Strain SAG4.97" /LENGTH=126 /DNA_ID=CAMNT_0042002037 /DNA_START=86 /DNA_END=466 /DNA_ORIENTATION=+